MRKSSSERHFAKNDQLIRFKRDYISVRWLKGPKIHEYDQTRKSLTHELDHRRHFHRMLEIGCGPATWTNLLSKRCEELYAVDISIEMSRIASAAVADNVKVICADFLDDSFGSDEIFDAIYAVRVFEYFNDKSKAIKKIAQALKKGGVLCLITKNPWYFPALAIRFLGKVTSKLGAKRLPKSIRDLIFMYADKIQSDWVSASKLKVILMKEGFDHVEVFPAVVGVFYSRFDSRIFAPLYAFFDLLSNTAREQNAPSILWPWVESYQISGVKSGVGN